MSINQREAVPGSYSGADLMNIAAGEFSQGTAQRTAKQLLRR